MERQAAKQRVQDAIEEIATSRSTDLLQVFVKQRYVLKKEQEYIRELQHVVSLKKALTRVDTITDFNPLTNTYFASEVERPKPETPEKRRLNRSVSVAIGDTAALMKQEKEKDRNPKPKTFKKLERTQSEPFLHTWEYNNIDITNELELPKHIFNGTMQVYLAQRWREKRFRLSFSTARLKDNMTQFDQPHSVDRQDDEVPLDIRDLLKEDQTNRKVKIIFEVNKEGKQVIAAGSPSDLLSSLIDKEYIDANYIELFLFSHDYWISSAELMKALTNYYRKPIKDAADPKAKHNEVIAFVIKKRIIYLLQQWLENYIYEIKDPDTVQPLNQFINELEQSKNEAERKWSKLLLDTWTRAMKKAQEFSIYCRPKADLAEKEKKLYKKNPAKLSFLDINPLELAKQLTLFDYQLIGRIAPNEFFNCNRKSGRSPNVEALIERNFRVSMWVATEILNTANDKQRAIVIGNFIQLCDNLMELRNYQSFINIYFGLKRPQVMRLKRTWSLLSNKVRQRWEALDSAITLESCIDFFNQTLLEPLPKVLPSQLFLRYIAIQDREPEQYEQDTSLLNFIKLRGIGMIVKHVRHSQLGLFPFEEVDYLQAYIRSYMQYADESELIKLTHNIERKQVRHRKSVLVVPQSNGTNLLKQSLGQHATNMIDTVILKPADTLIEEIHKEMLTKWNRPYAKCSIAADLPRLVSKIQVVDEHGQIMILRNHFQGKPLKKNPSKPQPQSIKDYIHVLLTICTAKLKLVKESAAVKIRFDEFFNPPRWQSSSSPRDSAKPLSLSSEVKKPQLGTSPGRSSGFGIIPRSGSSPDMESPRLSTSPTAIDPGSPPSSGSRKRISIGRAPSQLTGSQHIDSPTSPRSDNKRYSRDPEDHDLTKTLDRFIKDVFGEDNKLVTLLKSAASQGVLSPAWVRLKLFLLADFPFKDNKESGWIIVLEFSEEDVQVIHKKKERSVEETEEGQPDFEFCWELALVFPLSMEKLKSTQFVISSYSISEAMPKEQQNDFKTIMEQYKGPGYKRNKPKKKKENKAKRTSINL